MKILVLKTCDTCRRARTWLDGNGIAHEAHDVRTDGLTRETVERVVDAVGPERAVNRRSTTWRNLGAARETPLTQDHAVDLIMGEPTLMKRPVFLREHDVLVGFDDTVREALAKA